MVDSWYGSDQDDSEEILERLEESERLFHEDKARSAIGDFESSRYGFLLS